MISKKKTTVSVLRQLLGISLEDFAGLIGKSPSTVASLESGRLKLSEETASRIFQETHVSMNWLMSDDPKKKPWHFFNEYEYKTPYKKEVFELLQAQKKRLAGAMEPEPVIPGVSLVLAQQVVGDWFSVHYAASKAGRPELAEYLMRQFLDRLIERLGKDDEGFLKYNSGFSGLFLGDMKWTWMPVKVDGKSTVTVGRVESPDLSKTPEAKKRVRSVSKRGSDKVGS